jgi:hypothetical protein
MTTVYNSLESRLEQACLALITAAPPPDGTKLFAGQDSDDQALPAVVAYAQKGDDVDKYNPDGFYRCQVQVYCKTSADTDDSGASLKTAHDTLVATVRDALLQPNLPDLLTGSVDELTVLDAFVTGIENTVEGRCFKNVITFEFVAASNSL